MNVTSIDDEDDDVMDSEDERLMLETVRRVKLEDMCHNSTH